MQVRKIDTTFLVRLEVGDEVLTSLRACAAQNEIGFAAVQAIGALRRATLGFFDPGAKVYRHVPVEEQVEVVALSGNVSRGEDGEPVVHIHALLGREDGSTLGGHLVDGEVSPTLEVVLLSLPVQISRRRDPATGLVLLDLA
jgi:predicted DNA-binding protein with PD1-like motif